MVISPELKAIKRARKMLMMVMRVFRKRLRRSMKKRSARFHLLARRRGRRVNNQIEMMRMMTS
uniref:Uncharacterized protein n=1 Tax=Picea sitchensis TaxID=3332 RepID=A9NKZ8_PICSI|nr:unknown [Picea sitchensis]